MNKENLIYESPQVIEIELVVEQAILQASGGDYPSWGEELPL
jgi:hypothetical protein